jgi:hypothetical protein
MLKKLWIYFFISLLFIAAACAPRVVISPPRVEEEELTLTEIMERVSSDIEVVKAIAYIKIEKDSAPYSSVNASMLAKRPGWVHMRMYQLGMLVKDFIIKNGSIHVISGKNDKNLKKLGEELYGAVLWWDVIDGGVLSISPEVYIIKSASRDIYLDRQTLLPLRQEIKDRDRVLTITYSRPSDFEGLWHPSLMEMNAGNFKFTVTLKKMMKNPELGEFDFRLPENNL